MGREILEYRAVLGGTTTLHGSWSLVALSRWRTMSAVDEALVAAR